MSNQDSKFAPPTEERFPPVSPTWVDEADQPIVQPAPRTATQTVPQVQAQVADTSPLWVRLLANLFTVLIIATGALAIWYASYIYRNPYSLLNPLAPATPLPRVITATFLPPTLTPLVTANPLMSVTEVTQAAPLTATPNVTPTLLGERVVVVPLTQEATNTSPFAYLAQTPSYEANANGVGCAWLSIVGEVRGLDGTGQRNIGIQFTNQLDNQVATVFSGSAERFGSGGYEFYIGDTPQQLPYQVQLILNGQPVSEGVLAITSQKCEQNVLVLHFIQVQPYP